jgi:multidrug efflux pump
LLEKIPEVKSYFVIVGSPDATDVISFSRLVPWEERERTQQAIAASLQPKFYHIPGILVFVNNPASLGQSGSSQPIKFVVQTSSSYERLAEVVDDLLAEADKYPGFVNLDTDLELNQPQLKIDVDREKLADTGVGMQTVGRTLASLLGGRQVTRFNRNAEQYDVILQAADRDRSTPEDLSTLYVRG